MEYIVSHIGNVVTIGSTAASCKKEFQMNDQQFITMVNKLKYLYSALNDSAKLVEAEALFRDQQNLMAFDFFVRGVRGNRKKFTSIQDYVDYAKDGRSRFDIRGIQGTPNGYVIHPEITEDVFKTFCSKIAPFILRGKITKTDSDKIIKDGALLLGVAETKSDISISVDEKVVYFKSFHRVAHYNNDGSYEILADRNKGVDLRGKDYNNEEMKAMGSLVGEKTATTMHTVTFKKLGDKTFSVDQLFAELYCVDKQFTADSIKYLGFTPSNYMFKVLCHGTMWSVTFGDLEDVYTARAKNVSVRNRNLDSYWGACIADAASGITHPIYVTKISEKSGSAYSCRSNLHAKYPTMRDLYVDPSFDC